MLSFCPFFFFNDTATTEIYTLSLHDALPILENSRRNCGNKADCGGKQRLRDARGHHRQRGDRKSTRLNSSHQIISYAVFCLKKKKRHYHRERPADPHLHPVTNHHTTASSDQR